MLRLIYRQKQRLTRGNRQKDVDNEKAISHEPMFAYLFFFSFLLKERSKIFLSAILLWLLSALESESWRNVQIGWTTRTERNVTEIFVCSWQWPIGTGQESDNMTIHQEGIRPWPPQVVLRVRVREYTYRYEQKCTRPHMD